MILLPTLGSPTPKTSLIVPKSGLISSLDIVNFFGKNNKKIIIEMISEIILIKI